MLKGKTKAHSCTFYDKQCPATLTLSINHHFCLYLTRYKGQMGKAGKQCWANYHGHTSCHIGYQLVLPEPQFSYNIQDYFCRYWWRCQCVLEGSVWRKWISRLFRENNINSGSSEEPTVKQASQAEGAMRILFQNRECHEDFHFVMIWRMK